MCTYRSFWPVGGWAEGNHRASLRLNKTAGERSGLSHTHTHTHTQYSRHTFPPRLRPSLSEHHPSNTTLISCNPFPSSAGLLQYSALPPLGFTSLHYAEINAPRPHLAAPDSRQHANLPITHAALKGPGGLWVDYEEVSEGTRASELKVIKKLQRTPLQTPSVWDHTVSGSMVGGGTCTCQAYMW